MEEMTRLPEVVLNEFCSGNFGVQWNDDAPYTTVDLDHATEWVNGIGKASSSGYKAITQTTSALVK